MLKGLDLARCRKAGSGQMPMGTIFGQMPKARIGRIWPDAKGQDLARCQKAGSATIPLRYKVLLRYAARSVAA